MSGTVLLVEDDPDDSDLMLRALKREGVPNPVVVAQDGVEALDLLTAPQNPLRPALVVLDLNLPRMSGLELLERIRQEKELARLPVVVLTSSSEPSDRARARDLGVSSYMIKALDPQAFSLVIRAIRQYAKEISYEGHT